MVKMRWNGAVFAQRTQHCSGAMVCSCWNSSMPSETLKRSVMSLFTSVITAASVHTAAFSLRRVQNSTHSCFPHLTTARGTFSSMESVCPDLRLCSSSSTLESSTSIRTPLKTLLPLPLTWKCQLWSACVKSFPEAEELWLMTTWKSREAAAHSLIQLLLHPLEVILDRLLEGWNTVW